MKCKNCGKESSGNFCRYCGKKMEATVSFSDLLSVKQLKQQIELKQFEIERQQAEIEKQQKENARLQNQIEDFCVRDIREAELHLADLNTQVANMNKCIARLHEDIALLNAKRERTEKEFDSYALKTKRVAFLYRAIDYSIKNYMYYDPELDKFKLPDVVAPMFDDIAPQVTLKLHSMDLRDLRKAFNDNNKQIEKLLQQYSSRYTTKTNQAIYMLITVSMRSELQNILYTLKYEKLDKAILDVKSMTAKYLAIASDGNQSIAGTITAFVGQLEYLFINAVKIEHTYFVRKEQARQEQLAIKERMRQEAAERKALEEERKKIAAEESKFETEITKLREQLSMAAAEEQAKLNARIVELQTQLSDVVVKKENIINLQNGKAGNIYIISNMGSFGENIFKIGMTRRLDPQERVDELGSASVPFKFDVHSFIFSDDAVGLESRLHERLNDKRVNKVNLRKEFFYSTVDELEAIVQEIDPTAEFNKTMIAEEYRASQEDTLSPLSFVDFDSEEDEEGE